MCSSNSIFGENNWWWIIAVSYTHLDVYKRQLYHMLERDGDTVIQQYKTAFSVKPCHFVQVAVAGCGGAQF